MRKKILTAVMKRKRKLRRLLATMELARRLAAREDAVIIRTEKLKIMKSMRDFKATYGFDFVPDQLLSELYTSYDEFIMALETDINTAFLRSIRDRMQNITSRMRTIAHEHVLRYRPNQTPQPQPSMQRHRERQPPLDRHEGATDGGLDAGEELKATLVEQGCDKG